MQRDGAASADQCKVARIKAALDRHAANAVDHIVVDDAEHAVSGLLHAQAQWDSKVLFDGAARGLCVDAQATTEQVVRIQVAQRDVGIGHRGQLATTAIAGRTGLGAGRLRPDVEHAHAVDPANRAAPGAQGFNLDHRCADAVAQEVHVLADIGAATLGQRDVE